jgi:hypothetical protein
MCQDDCNFAVDTVTVHPEFFLALQPNVDYDVLIHEVSISHTTTHHSR